MCAGEKLPCKVSMFRHPLVSNFILNVFAKLPIHPMATTRNVLEIMCYRIAVSVFQRRIAARYIEGDAQFHMIEYEIADSAREGTCVVSMTVTAEPKDWESATRAAVQARTAPGCCLSYLGVHVRKQGSSREAAMKQEQLFDVTNERGW